MWSGTAAAQLLGGQAGGSRVRGQQLGETLPQYRTKRASSMGERLRVHPGTGRKRAFEWPGRSPSCFVSFSYSLQKPATGWASLSLPI